MIKNIDIKRIRKVLSTFERMLCIKCLFMKDRDEFYDKQSGLYGKRAECKVCWDEKTKRYADKNSEGVNLIKKKWRSRNPEKYKAHCAVSNAVRDGKLIKGSCEACGATKVHGHHDDYSKPLDVNWLCPIHHSVVQSNTP